MVLEMTEITHHNQINIYHLTATFVLRDSSCDTDNDNLWLHMLNWLIGQMNQTENKYDYKNKNTWSIVQIINLHDHNTCLIFFV